MTGANDFFAETNDFEDTPKERVEQQKKRDALKDVINQGKAHLLDGKKPWTFKRIGSMNDEDIDKIYCEYKQREIQQKGADNRKSSWKTRH